MSAHIQAITKNRAFEIVTPAELKALDSLIRYTFRYHGVRDAVEYLADKPKKTAVRVKVLTDHSLKRMRESAIGYAERRGFLVSTRHQGGWLYIVKGE